MQKVDYEEVAGLKRHILIVYDPYNLKTIQIDYFYLVMNTETPPQGPQGMKYVGNYVFTWLVSVYLFSGTMFVHKHRPFTYITS